MNRIVMFLKPMYGHDAGTLAVLKDSGFLECGTHCGVWCYAKDKNRKYLEILAYFDDAQPTEDPAAPKLKYRAGDVVVCHHPDHYAQLGIVMSSHWAGSDGEYTRVRLWHEGGSIVGRDALVIERAFFGADLYDALEVIDTMPDLHGKSDKQIDSIISAELAVEQDNGGVMSMMKLKAGDVVVCHHDHPDTYGLLGIVVSVEDLGRGFFINGSRRSCCVRVRFWLEGDRLGDSFYDQDLYSLEVIDTMPDFCGKSYNEINNILIAELLEDGCAQPLESRSQGNFIKPLDLPGGSDSWLLAIDVSPSMKPQDTCHFLANHLDELKYKVACTLTFDIEIVNKYVGMPATTDLALKERGRGTDIACVCDFALHNRFENVLIFSDGYFYGSEATIEKQVKGLKVLIVRTPDGNAENLIQDRTPGDLNRTIQEVTQFDTPVEVAQRLAASAATVKAPSAYEDEECDGWGYEVSKDKDGWMFRAKCKTCGAVHVRPVKDIFPTLNLPSI